MCLSQELLPDDLSRFCDCERVRRIRADEQRQAVARVNRTGWRNLGDILKAILDRKD